MGFNVTVDNGSQGTHQVVHLSWVGTTDGVGNTDSVDTNLVDGSVNVQQIDNVGSEGIFGGESDFNTLGLDEFNDFDGRLGNVVHVLTVGVLSQVLGGTNDNIHTVNTGLDGNSGIVHMTSDVS
ncbi:hypothetical protein WICPIJ_010055 [Wickerhamomyces pijperi]|uniref:Uncharacterized protein n=1 Tax=Wickerhamomyces pijperi TaxID=599730 RepID=A0A9P8PIY5_WICPI|nr:hypothetical protein WICPIJ_010055 [Wickerhamomyces pijperi]